MLICVRACMHNSVCPATICRCAQAYAVHVSLHTPVPSRSPCIQWFPQELQASPRTRSSHIWALWLITTGTKYSRGSTQCRARVR